MCKMFFAAIVWRYKNNLYLCDILNAGIVQWQYNILPMVRTPSLGWKTRVRILFPALICDVLMRE